MTEPYVSKERLTLEALKRAMFPEEMARIDRSECPFCGESVSALDFRDALSAKEFKISGLCQKCQDDTFGR